MQKWHYFLKNGFNLKLTNKQKEAEGTSVFYSWSDVQSYIRNLVRPKFIISFEGNVKIDIADSFDWYSNISTIVADNFLIEINKAVTYLEEKPL
ncbi:MAG: hypothetical protein ACPGUH_00475 [Winogradskyella sp.]